MHRGPHTEKSETVKSIEGQKEEEEDPLVLPGGMSMAEAEKAKVSDDLELRKPLVSEIPILVDAFADPRVPASDKEVSIVLLIEALSSMPFADIEKYAWGGSVTAVLSIVADQLRQRGPLVVPAGKLAALMACSTVAREEMCRMNFMGLLADVIDSDSNAATLCTALEALAAFAMACYSDVLGASATSVSFWNVGGTTERQRRASVVATLETASRALAMMEGLSVPDRMIYLLSMAPSIPSAPIWLRSALELVRAMIEIENLRRCLTRARLPAVLETLQRSELADDAESRVISSILASLTKLNAYDRSLARASAARALQSADEIQ